jgi:hypothetical protein
MQNLPDLPAQKFQDAFERAKDEAEREYAIASKRHPNLAVNYLNRLTRKVFFAYCAQLRKAFGKGLYLAVREVQQTASTAWPVVCHHYWGLFGSRSSTEEVRTQWCATVWEEARSEWKEHDLELIALADSQADNEPAAVEAVKAEQTDTQESGRSESSVDNTLPVLSGVDSRTAADGRGNMSGQPSFPNRATWLKNRLLERGWGNSHPSQYRGPDRKTVEKILRGEGVRNDVLEKLADALSRKRDKVTVLSIPQD